MQLVPALVSGMVTCCSSSSSHCPQQKPSLDSRAVLPDEAGPEWDMLQAAASLLCTLLAGHPEGCSQVCRLACSHCSAWTLGMHCDRAAGVHMNPITECCGPECGSPCVAQPVQLQHV